MLKIIATVQQNANAIFDFFMLKLNRFSSGAVTAGNRSTYAITTKVIDEATAPTQVNVSDVIVLHNIAPTVPLG